MILFTNMVLYILSKGSLIRMIFIQGISCTLYFTFFNNPFMVFLTISETDFRKNLLLDEFIVPVLQEISFSEINFTKQFLLDQNKEFGLSIKIDMENVIPYLGSESEPINISWFKNVEEMKKSIKSEGFNWPLSKMISPNRTLPTTRHPNCKKIYDIKSLPTLSVILPCYNEPLTTLSRTIHSIINRTPESLLKEIIIVDDMSFYEELHGKLERYILTHFPLTKVRLVRLKKRAGLIKARMIGAYLAKGDVLVFLDSHSEVEQMWAEPILERIKENRKTVVNPMAVYIYPETLFYARYSHFFRSGFEWRMFFQWINIPDYELKRRKTEYSPVRSPTMMGAAIGIDRKYFWEIGSFDPGMETWGGENLEMSFRVWQCGGQIEIVPCSRVGHLWRSSHTYNFTFGQNNSNSHSYNTARMAEVWMDEYKELFYEHAPEMRTNFGDISKRKLLRERLNCKSFKWYLDNVYREKFRQQFDQSLIAVGQIANIYFGYCIDVHSSLLNSTKIGLYPCNSGKTNTQTYYFTNKSEWKLDDIYHENQCIISANEETIIIDTCPTDETFKRQWGLNVKKKKIVHIPSQKCLMSTRKEIKLGECSGSNELNKWRLISNKRFF